jgi:cyclohexa-1,5-dienecarbonyl-CoA hydratase
MSDPAVSPIEVRLDGRVLRLTLDRPPLNILDRGALDALAAALEEARVRGEAKVILLRGAGRAFCAGVDVADHTADRVAGMIASFRGVVEALLAAECPVVAAVRGAALGGGMELALACDIVLIREDARLGQPEIRLGVFPPAAVALLPRLVGRQRAMDLILSGRSLSADEAYHFGLASRVLAADRFEEEVDAYVDGLAEQSGPVLRLTKRAVRDALESSVSDALDEADRLYLEELMALEDPHEGLAAFTAKRQPAWKEA